MAKPDQMEDFFACTIVVRTNAEIVEANDLVLSFYNFKSRRPKDNSKTHKTSSDFAFDDLRLYVARRPAVSGKYPQLDGLVFEVQIKTILQHAWTVATHDLIYKSDTVSWPRERIAFQIKAMLEHAEVAISETDHLANAPAVAKMNSRTTGILFIVEHLNNFWTSDRLPKDVKRLAEVIFDVLCACKIKPDQFPIIIEAEKQRLNLIPEDLSPYALTIQALAQNSTAEFKRKLDESRVRTKIVIHSGMDLPTWMLGQHPKILNFENN